MHNFLVFSAQTNPKNKLKREKRKIITVSLYRSVIFDSETFVRADIINFPNKRLKIGLIFLKRVVESPVTELKPLCFVT